MTYPDDPSPSLHAGQEALFAAAAAEYDRYRPGVPAEAAQLLADTVRDLPDPTLLDLGTGTGQVPRALLKALPTLAYIEGVCTAPSLPRIGKGRSSTGSARWPGASTSPLPHGPRLPAVARPLPRPTGTWPERGPI
ncbi:hypothetical protein AB0D27_33855 [Streptomyces sp. NPDC048415]|uniref:hypothetical protein n=1 Tax=Streptomyces sp. NPDC048415 TaxID=3154822 RepID=UPI0034343F54